MEHHFFRVFVLSFIFIHKYRDCRLLLVELSDTKNENKLGNNVNYFYTKSCIPKNTMSNISNLIDQLIRFIYTFRQQH